MLVQQEVDEETGRAFAELSELHPETPYGRYAVAGLALIRFQDTIAEHGDKGGTGVWEPVARELAAAERLFTGKHPLREKVLFRLAQVRVVCGDYAGARKYLAAVKKDFPRGKLGSKAEDFEKKFSELEEQNRPNGEQP